MYKVINYWKMIFSIIFSLKKKVFVLCQPNHANLGDQAQLMCTEEWVRNNYPGYKQIHIGYLRSPFITNYSINSLINEFICRFTILVLKIKVSKNDIFLGHSGYFMIDHHNGWKMFVDMMRLFPNNQMLIMPQTVNFYTPFIKKYVSSCFSNNKNVTLLCRDEVSLSISKELFPTTKLLLYPDIVTSLIGTRTYNKDRDGILFCMRDDLEMLYDPEEINLLMSRFKNIRHEKIDTTLHNISSKEMNENRTSIINDMIEKIASYRVVITDRYHGTIFSAIASTPVIVISSADHKLSSGVKWFPENEFNDSIQYAASLDEAYNKAVCILSQENRTYCNPSYFKNNYWDRLKSCLDQ